MQLCVEYVMIFDLLIVFYQIMLFVCVYDIKNIKDKKRYKKILKKF